MSSVEKLSRERWKVAFILTACMVFSYFGFILLVAFQKPLMGSQLVPGLSLGITLGAAVIGSAWILTFIYVRFANKHDEKIKELEQAKQSEKNTQEAA